MRTVVHSCTVGNEPAPAFERLLNKVLTRTIRPKYDFRAADYKHSVAREARVTYETVDRYFHGESVNHFTRKRICAAVRRLES